MTAAMETMEKLLHEADNKFLEKLRLCQQGIATNMNLYSDRTYNLRQQVTHNPHFTSDDHFMSMLNDVEQALAPEFTFKGEVDKKLTSLLCGLLKTLLRETVSQQMYSLRKIQIEMIWQWYEDKKKQVLDFAIGMHRDHFGGQKTSLSDKRTDTTSSSNMDSTLNKTEIHVIGAGCDVKSPLNTTTSQSPTSKFGGRLKTFLMQTGTADGDASTTASSSRIRPANRDLAIRDDSSGADAATIAKKFSLYKKRNLSKAEKLRQELNQSAGAQPSAPDASIVGGVKIVYTKDAKSRQKKVTEARTSLVVMRHGPSGPPSFLHHESKAPFFTRESSDGDLVDNAVANSQVHVLRHLTSRLAEESDLRDLRDSMTMFDFNRSRLEEETNRRLEAEMYASQLGRTCHANALRKPNTTSMTAGSGSMATATEKVNPMHFNIGKPLRPETAKPMTQAALDVLHFKTYEGTSTTLSPYDQRQPTRMDEFKLQEFLNRLQPNGVAAARLSQSLPSREQAMNTSGVSAAHTRLDVTLAADVKVTTSGPRIDIPIVEMLLGPSDADSSVPSFRQIQELQLASRVREAFASDRKANRPGSAHHYPRAKIEKAILTPDDLPTDDCFRLLPTYGSFLPRRPASAKR